MIVSVTRLRLRNFWNIFRFFKYANPAIRQVKQAPGLKDFRITGFTTATLWESEQAMLAFRNNGAHLKAMKGGLAIVKWAVATHYEGERLPTKKEVDDLMINEQKKRGFIK